MGYGGSRTDAGRAIGRSGDGGIDGIIDEDRLGLDSIYIQAKRWEGNVGRPEIQSLSERCTGNERGRAFSSPRLPSRPMPSTLPGESRIVSF